MPRNDLGDYQSSQKIQAPITKSILPAQLTRFETTHHSQEGLTLKKGLASAYQEFSLCGIL